MKKNLSMVCVLVGGMMLAACGETRAEVSGFASYYKGGDLGDGYGAGGSVGCDLVGPLAIDGRISYVEFDVGDTAVIPCEAALLLKFPFLPGTQIYGGVGVGYYFFLSGAVDLEDSFGYYPVTGLAWTLGPVGAYAHARWLFLEPDLDAFSADLPGVTSAELDSVVINIGVSFKF